MIIVLMLVTSLSATYAQKAKVTSLIAAHAQGTWVAHIKGGLHMARQLAANHDFTLVDQVEGFEDHYSLVPRRFSKRNGPDNSIRKKIEEHPLVLWAEEQIAKERTKRYPARSDREFSDHKASNTEADRSKPTSGEREFSKTGNTASGEREFSDRKIGNTAPDRSDGSDDIWVSEMEERRASHQSYGDRQSRGIFSYFLSRYWHVFNDSLWKNQWYLQDYRTSGDVPVLDLNVVPCYEEGVTGKGVKIAILDDGLEWDHPDLRENYDPSISIDLIEGDRDPKPRYSANVDNSHGTRCAGEIAMVANNSFCGVGVAFNARVGGIKLLDGPTTDLVEGKALIYALDQVDIYSSSWGPPDNGREVEAPGRVASKAFEIGINKGREGRGAIYVFAAGNGKSLGDSCAADGYINSVYTVAVASATQSGQPPYYGERCAAIITTAYSSGNRNEERIATTDIRGKCTTRHSGTSAAAPLAAGIIGLALQANPSLTWRCVQHIITWTSEVAVLGDDDNWHKNGAGFWVNTNFGFGLLNAHNMVKLARRFKQVPHKSICHLEHPTSDSKFDFTTTSRAHISFQSNGCSGTDKEINYLEHVQVIISLSYPYRGAVGILLESPSGTKTVLMETRPRDNSTDGLTAWTLTSVHQWGEPADGRWTVKVGAKVVEGQVGEGGHFADFKNGVSRLTQHQFGSHRDNDVDERHDDHYDRHPVTSDEDRSADHYRLSDLERRLIDLGTSSDDLHENANELRPSLDDLEPHRNFHQPSLDKVEGHVNEVEPSFGDLGSLENHNRPSFGDLENPGHHKRPSFGDLESPETHNRPSFGDLESPETHNRPTFGDLENPDHLSFNDLESRETHHRPSFEGLDDLMMDVGGHVTSVRILLHGTREMPDHYKDGRRGYSTYGHPREMDDTDEDDVNRKKERSKRRMV